MPDAARAGRPAALRLFTALWPGVATRAALATCRDALRWPSRSRPTATPKLHLTLHFIGALPAERLAALVAALPAPAGGFDLRFGELQLWRGGLVALMPRSIPDVLVELHEAQAAALRSLGLPVDRRQFRPHVTLGRDGPRQFDTPPPDIELRWPVRAHVLVCSRPDGRYEVLQRYTVR